MVSVRIFQLREVPVGNLRTDQIKVTVLKKKQTREPLLKTCFSGTSIVKPSKILLNCLKTTNKTLSSNISFKLVLATSIESV